LGRKQVNHNRWQHWLLLGLLTLSLVLGAGLAQIPAQAQFPNPLGAAANTPPLGVRRIGLLEVTTVVLDGDDLFEIASPMVLNRNEPGDQVPVEVRARQIEINLNQVVSQAINYTVLDADLLAPDVLETELIQITIEQRQGLPVLVATVGNLPEPRGLVTITDSDAQYHGLSKAVLADLWQEDLQAALPQALANRQPGALRGRIRRMVLIFLVSVLLTLVLAAIWQTLGWRKRLLERKQTAEGSDLPPVSDQNHLSRAALPQILRYQISLEQRLQLVAFLRWLMFWGIAFVWVTALASIMYLFPQTRGYASGLFSTPVLLLITWFATGLVNRVANIAIDRIAQAWEKNELGSLENIQQRAMRISTITRATKGFKTVLIYALAVLLLLQLLQLAPASLLAFGAVVALALSFAAQNLVKDLVNGFLILLEDQYAIGDLVTAGTTTGIVENLNLRITQIRGEDGRLVTLPNSLIAQVDNLSRNWSRATLNIDVAYGTDVDHALAVVHETAHALAKDPTWRYTILNPTEMLGVEAMTHSGLTILIWIRTRPLKQFLVAREFRRRLRMAFEQEGIAIGVPQQVLTGLKHQDLALDEG
jgi:moderate conductance mechanosensitive channel